MSVAYLLGRYPTASNTFVYREIAALMGQGESIEVYALSRTREFNGDILPDHAIQPVPTAHSVMVADSISDQLAEEWLSHGGRAKDLRRARWLARKWRRSGVSCVHTHFLGFSAALASIACAIANIPLVVTVHARGIFVPDDFSFLALRRAASLIAISEETRRVIAEKSGRDSVVLPVAIGEAIPARSGGSNFHILSVGRPVAKKGYPNLRTAISSLHGPVHWTVAGATEAEVGGAMNRLTALGAVPFERINAIYKEGVDVFALSCCEGPDGDVDGIPVAI